MGAYLFKVKAAVDRALGRPDPVNIVSLGGKATKEVCKELMPGRDLTTEAPSFFSKNSKRKAKFTIKDKLP